MFKFADNKMIKSFIKKVQFAITTDAVAYNIPFLLSKDAMKKANTKIDFQEDKISIFGKGVDIKFFRSLLYNIRQQVQ